MRFIALFIFSVISNIVAFLAALYFITGFQISTDFADLLITGSVFALLNMLVRPILKLILGPIIFLTLGFGILIVNAIILYILDILDSSITIQDTITLIYATLIISGVNLITNLAGKSLFRSE